MKIKICYLFIALFFSSTFFACTSSKEITDYNFISREEWNALDAKPFNSQVPERITIHHEGTVFDPEKRTAATSLKNIQSWGMGEARNWSDIPYHFIIDFEGNVFEGRNPFTTGETATDYDPSGHLLISCFGNFEEQFLTEKQFNSLVNLISEMCLRFDIAPETIKGHKDYTTTLCPGKNLYKYLENGELINAVKRRISKLK